MRDAKNAPRCPALAIRAAFAVPVAKSIAVAAPHSPTMNHAVRPKCRSDRTTTDANKLAATTFGRVIVALSSVSTAAIIAT